MQDPPGVQKADADPHYKLCSQFQMSTDLGYSSLGSLSEAERKKSKPVTHCLSSLAEYMDHMSFLDSSLHYHPLQAEGSCRPQDFGWTGAKVKSGMTDDIRLECVSRVNSVSVDEMHAALGHLSFRKCKALVSEAWDRAQQLEDEIRREAEEELSLPVAPHRDGFSLAQVTPCEPW